MWIYNDKTSHFMYENRKSRLIPRLSVLINFSLLYNDENKNF